MEDESSIKPISLSDLLHRSRPVTAASFLPSGHPTPRLIPQKHPPQQSSYTQTPNTSKILKPFHCPTFLIGTLNLTTHSSSCSNSNCLQFSDHSATVCCDVLDLDIRVITQTIRVLAWNFLPVKPHGGYLEIIRWTLDQIQTISIPNFNAFYLNSVIPTHEQSIIPRQSLHGLLQSVSPVTNVPCTANKTGTKTLTGFLAEITVCECELCSSRNPTTLPQSYTQKHSKNHIFTKSKILYFCGSASIWYPAISRLVGTTVSISGMKKKMIFLGEDKSLMMYVTTDKAIIHLPCKTTINGRNTNTSSIYTGSITATYMQGMVVELDQKVLVLLTDNQLSVSHSLRIGAIVTVRNFHIEDPKFSWTKVIIFGSCYKTSIRVNVFSPIESGCYQVLQSRSLLRKFIESLQFSARLWVLLVISSVRKKFTGVLSEMEILGSRHMEGLVQKYCSSCLPLSVFRFRHGVLSEYCLHDLCGCSKEIDYDAPKLVVPISNLISQCEDMFIKSLYDTKRQYNNIVCGGKSHDQPIRKILKSEDMNIVLLGNLRVSEYSGKLQLIDATGSIDVVITDLPSVWSIKDIYEIKEFNVVMEGFSRDLEHLKLVNNEPFTCGNIFNHFRLPERKKINIYIHCYMKDKSINHILCPSVDMEENLKEFESGLFHLILLVHKFPIQQKFPGDFAVSNNSSVYAEAVILSWNLALRNEIDSIDSSRDDKRCDLSSQHEFPCTVYFYGEKSTVNSGDLLNCTTVAKKVLLEFKSDSFCKFESLRIGGYYLIKHHYKCSMCTTKGSNKVSVDSKSHIWNVSFSADVVGPAAAGSICLHLSVDHLSYLEVKLTELKQGLIQPTNSIKVTSAPTPSGAFNVNLPTGNLLSVQGRVMAVHTSGQSRPLTRAHPRIVHRVTNTSSVCIHVLVDRNIVKIYSNLSEHSYPTGLGPRVKANFHRVLLTVEGGMLRLTPASFIEIGSIIIDDNQCNNENDPTSVKSVVGTTTSLLTGPTVLVSEMTHFSVRKKIRLHCKVVCVYILVMEKKSELLQSSKVNSRVEFPLAGFIMDDGSSSCCCWMDTETVLTLLGSREWSPHKRSKTSLHKGKKKKLEACSDTMSRLSDVLNQNGRVVIKNNRSVCDSAGLDAIVTVDSESVVKELDEQFLKAMILQVCSSHSWNVVGSVLDSEGLNQIEEELQRVDMMVKLPLVNIWASEVSHLDILNEGRSILHELLKSD